MPEENVIALELESVKAGLVPVSAERVLDRLAEHARARGIDIDWKTEGGVKTAYARYESAFSRNDVVLENVVLAEGQIRLSGRSDRSRGVVESASAPTQGRFSPRFRSSERPNRQADIVFRSGQSARQLNPPNSANARELDLDLVVGPFDDRVTSRIHPRHSPSVP